MPNTNESQLVQAGLSSLNINQYMYDVLSEYSERYLENALNALL